MKYSHILLLLILSLFMVDCNNNNKSSNNISMTSLKPTELKIYEVLFDDLFDRVLKKSLQIEAANESYKFGESINSNADFGDWSDIFSNIERNDSIYQCKIRIGGLKNPEDNMDLDVDFILFPELILSYKAEIITDIEMNPDIFLYELFSKNKDIDGTFMFKKTKKLDNNLTIDLELFFRL